LEKTLKIMESNRNLLLSSEQQILIPWPLCEFKALGPW